MVAYSYAGATTLSRSVERKLDMLISYPLIVDYRSQLRLARAPIKGSGQSSVVQ